MSYDPEQRLLLPPERAGGLMQPPARLPEYVPPPPRDWETAEPGEAVPRPLKPRPRPKPSPESGAATTPPT